MNPRLVIAKACSYKAMTTIFLVAVAYWRTGSVKTALAFGIGDAVIKLILYSAHEALWSKALAAKAMAFDIDVVEEV